MGLGFDEFSVSSPQVPAVKYALRKLNFRECKEMAQEAIKCGDQEEVLDVCRKIAITSYPFFLIFMRLSIKIPMNLFNLLVYVTNHLLNDYSEIFCSGKHS